jgi:regulator of replication initiation timing
VNANVKQNKPEVSVNQSPAQTPNARRRPSIGDVINDEVLEVGSLTSMHRLFESKLKNIDRKIDAHNNKLMEQVGEILKSLSYLSDRMDEYDKKMEIIDHLAKENSSLRLELNSVTARVEDLEQRARRKNIVEQNIPETKNEDLTKIMSSLSNFIGIPISGGDIKKVHRVARAAEAAENTDSTPAVKRPKNIIVHFTCENLRNSFIEAARKKKNITTGDVGVKGEHQQIFVAEHLTPSRKKLFWEVRRAAKQKNYRFAWVKHGKIYARKNPDGKVIPIKCAEDISRMV